MLFILSNALAHVRIKPGSGLTVRDASILSAVGGRPSPSLVLLERDEIGMNRHRALDS